MLKVRKKDHVDNGFPSYASRRAATVTKAVMLRTRAQISSIQPDTLELPFEYWLLVLSKVRLLVSVVGSLTAFVFEAKHEVWGW